MIKCLVVAEKDPVTNKIRRGALLRLIHPPSGVRYSLARQMAKTPKILGHYEFTLHSSLASIAKFAAEHFFPVQTSNFSIVHSFYWNLHRYGKPWIHENDQSPSQFLGRYVNSDGWVARQLKELFSSYINSSLCKKTVVWSDWARKGYESDGIDKSKIAVIPPPSPVRNHRISHEGVNILFLGRDFLRKGGDISLQLFWRLSKEFENVRMIFVGEINQSDILRRVHADSKIRYFRQPDDSLLYSYIYPLSDIFVLPTRNDAFALSIVEAMSYGIPVVTTRRDALPELIMHSVNGYLASQNDTEEFTNLTAKLIENEELRNRMSLSAKQFVSHRFSPAEIGKKLMQIYEDAMIQ
ncbi:MAG: glycosyltransferase family 4 protein [Conexivisphaerales archaeon]